MEEAKEIPEKELKHQARRRSIQEGIFAVGAGSFGGNYISPFAIAINSSNAVISFLSSFSGLLGPLSQMFSSRLVEKHSRKSIVLRGVFFEAILWLAYVAIAFLYYKGTITSYLPILLILFFSIQSIMANMASPAWFSWMGDIVDNEYRGRWFAKRNFILGVISIVLTISASFALDYFKTKNWLIQGFMLFFAIAMICRLTSCAIFRKQYEPKMNLEDGYYFSFKDFVKKAPSNNFGKFTIFRAFLSLAVNIASPLVVVYLLRDLQLSYSMYMIVIFSGSAVALFFLELWGKFADKYGNRTTMIITSIIIPIIPLLWLISDNPIFLAIIPSILGELAWTGFNLASGNFIYDSVTPSRRGIVVSYYNMLNGIGVFLGAGLGGILIQYLSVNGYNPLIIIFVISAVARLIVLLLFLPKVQEVRPTTKFKFHHLLRWGTIKQIKPLILGDFQQLVSIKDYIRGK